MKDASRSPFERTALAVWAGALGLAFLARWPFRSRHLYEWDSGNYALGIHEFDLHKHQPHPPGYPIYIQLARASHAVIRDVNDAMIALGFVFTAVAMVLFYRLAARLYGRSVAVLGTSLLAFSPVVIFYDLIACTYPVDLLGSVLLGGLALRLWSGDTKAGPWAVFSLAVLAGTRESGAILLAPVVLVALARAYRRDVARWGIAVAIFVPTIAAWYVPTALETGGFGELHDLSWQAMHAEFAQRSTFYGAPAAAHFDMLQDVVVWGVAAFFPAVVAALVGLGLRAAPRPAADDAAAATLASPGALFYALWIAPNILTIALVDAMKPGDWVLVLPPVTLLCARAAALGLEVLGAVLRVTPLVPAALLALVAGMASTVFVAGDYGPELNRTTLTSVRASDEDAARLLNLVHSDPGPDATMVFLLGATSEFGPNRPQMRQELANTTFAAFDGQAMQVFLPHYKFRLDEEDRKEIPDEVQRLVWILPPRAPLPPTLTTSFGAREVFTGPAIHVLTSDIGEGKLDGDLDWQGASHRIGRGAMAGLDCRLGQGFLPPQDRNAPWEPLWGMGPRSDLSVHLARPESVTVWFLVEDAVAKEQQSVEVTLDGAPLLTATPRHGEPLVVTFDGTVGDHTVTLAYSHWNHHPDEFAPGNPRPFGVAFKRATCIGEDGARDLFAAPDQ